LTCVQKIGRQQRRQKTRPPALPPMGLPPPQIPPDWAPLQLHFHSRGLCEKVQASVRCARREALPRRQTAEAEATLRLAVHGDTWQRQKQPCICLCRLSPRSGGLSPRNRRDTHKKRRHTQVDVDRPGGGKSSQSCTLVPITWGPAPPCASDPVEEDACMESALS
jgi:hypothetical protein